MIDHQITHLPAGQIRRGCPERGRRVKEDEQFARYVLGMYAFGGRFGCWHFLVERLETHDEGLGTAGIVLEKCNIFPIATICVCDGKSAGSSSVGDLVAGV